jgi:hypothetical protein
MNMDKFLGNEVTRWNSSNVPLELHQHLRMSWEECKIWSKTGELPRNMAARWGFKEE